MLASLELVPLVHCFKRALKSFEKNGGEKKKENVKSILRVCPKSRLFWLSRKGIQSNALFSKNIFLYVTSKQKNAVLNFTLPVALSKISFFHEEQNIPQCIVVRHSIRAAKILSVRMGLQRQRCQEEATLYGYVSCHQPGTQLKRSFLLTANHSNLDFLTLSSYF